MKPFWLFVIAGSQYACGAAQSSPEACLAPQLAGIESRYFREAVELCQGMSWDTCTARPYLEEKYDALRKEAVESCR